jgi:hypothetical protein
VSWAAAVVLSVAYWPEKLGVPYYDKALTKPLEEKFNMTSD